MLYVRVTPRARTTLCVQSRSWAPPTPGSVVWAAAEEGGGVVEGHTCGAAPAWQLGCQGMSQKQEEDRLGSGRLASFSFVYVSFISI